MNYGDKHTEDSLSSRLGRLYGIERGLDCGRMSREAAESRKKEIRESPRRRFL